MRNDQRVRIVGIVGVVAAYLGFVVFNGSPPVDAGPVGVYDPLAVVALSTLVLALPETLNYLPVGPTHPAEQPAEPDPPQSSDGSSSEE